MKIETRFKIVGTEVVGLGAFLLIVLFLELRSSHEIGVVQSFGWDCGIVGTTLILVGLEILSLIKYLPSKTSAFRVKKDYIGKSVSSDSV